jgi:hypothetical protein
VSLFFGVLERRLEGISQADREIVKGQESTALPRTLELTVPCEFVCYD